MCKYKIQMTKIFIFFNRSVKQLPNEHCLHCKTEWLNCGERKVEFCHCR